MGGDRRARVPNADESTEIPGPGRRPPPSIEGSNAHNVAQLPEEDGEFGWFEARMRDTVHELKTFITGSDSVTDARAERIDDRVRSQTEDIPAQDVIYEQFAHVAAYGGEVPETLWGYQELDRFTDSETDFSVVSFAPLPEMIEEHRQLYGRELRPIVAFRGTVNTPGWLDDTNVHGVGQYQFAANEPEIVRMLEDAAVYGRVDLMGHSLGGALAQMTACRYPSSVGRVATFQSPQISRDDAFALEDYNRENTGQAVESTHYRAAGDVVPRAGEAMTPGDVYRFDHLGWMDPGSAHVSFPLADLNAQREEDQQVMGIHGGGQRVADVQRFDSYSEAEGGSILDADIAEPAREGAGLMVEGGNIILSLSAYDMQTMGAYVTIWNQVQAECEAGTKFDKIEHVIREQTVLSDSQRERMVDNARFFYGNAIDEAVEQLEVMRQSGWDVRRIEHWIATRTLRSPDKDALRDMLRRP